MKSKVKWFLSLLDLIIWCYLLDNYIKRFCYILKPLWGILFQHNNLLHYLSLIIVSVTTLPLKAFILNQQGIGNTSQGAANCIMFVLFTQPIRTRLCTALCCCSKCRAEVQRSDDAPHRLLPGQDPSTQREEDSTARAQTDRWWCSILWMGRQKLTGGEWWVVSASHWTSLQQVPAERVRHSAGACTSVLHTCTLGDKRMTLSDRTPALGEAFSLYFVDLWIPWCAIYQTLKCQIT